MDIADLVVVMANAGAGAERLPSGSVTDITPPNWAEKNGSMYFVQTEAADPPETCVVHELLRLPEDEIKRMSALGDVAVVARRAFKVPTRNKEAFILSKQVRYVSGKETFLAVNYTRVYEVVTALSEPLLARFAAITPPSWRY